MPATLPILAALATAGALAGAGFWLVVLAGTLAFRRAHPELHPAPATDGALVSVVVPANDEEANLATCLRSLLAQTHAALELIVIDDRSRDRTRAIAEEAAGADARVRVLHADALPAGWTGKTHALSLGAALARGDWLFCTDADTEHHPGMLAALLQYARRERLDLLSGWPALRVAATLPALVDVVCGGVLASWYRARTRDGATRSAAFANGQALLIRAATLRAVGGHEAVRGRLLEDVALAEAVEAKGGRLAVVRLARLVRVRSYPTLRACVSAWARIFVEGSHRRRRRLLKPAVALPLAALAGWIAIGVGLAAGAAAPLLAGLAAVAISAAVAAFVYTEAHLPLWPALLLPITTPAVSLALVRAARAARGGAIEWHGVRYDSRAGDARR